MFYLPQTMSATPVEYQRTFIGPETRWWRILLGILAGIFTFGFLSLILIAIPFFIPGLDGNEIVAKLNGQKMDLQDPIVLVFLALSLAVIIPASQVGSLVAFRSKIGFLHSVVGRMRWGWLALSTLVSFAFSFTLIVGIESLVSWELPAYNPNPRLWLMILLVVTLIPLQSAGEEYIFRGFLPQVIGALIPWRKVGLVISVVVSSALFGAAHGSFDPATFLQLAGFGMAAWILTYRTGGLEAAIGLHAMNNVTIFVKEMFAGVSDSLVGEDTVTPWYATVLVLVVMVIQVFTIDVIYRKWEARKPERRHLTDPAQRPLPTPDYLRSKFEKGQFYPEYFNLYPPHVQQQYAYLVPGVVPEQTPTAMPAVAAEMPVAVEMPVAQPVAPEMAMPVPAAPVATADSTEDVPSPEVTENPQTNL